MKKGLEFWKGHVAAARLESIPASQYARDHGLAASALYYWQQKPKSESDACKTDPVSKFVALRVAEPASGQRCLLALPSGLQLS